MKRPAFETAPKGPAGLVHYSTTQTGYAAPKPEAVARARGASACAVVDRKAHRLSRMRTGTITAARLVNETCAREGFRFKAWFVTLTYAPGEHWKPNHIRDFVTRLRMWQSRAGQKLRYVWTAEMQQRGAVHYHLIIWLKMGVSLPKPDKRGWWPYGSTNREIAKNPVAYIAKYASKGADGPAFPAGIRICGAGGMDREARRQARWWKAPKDCRHSLGEQADIRRTLGGRFDAASGEFWASLWRVVRINGVLCIVKGIQNAA